MSSTHNQIGPSPAGAPAVPSWGSGAAVRRPGFLATPHVLAAHAQEVAIERIVCELGAVRYPGTVPLRDGAFELPDRPGLGADPEPDLHSGAFVVN